MAEDRFISRSLDQRACDVLGGDIESRSVFEVASSIRTLIGCDDLSTRIHDMAADPDDPHQLADANDIADAVDRSDDELLRQVCIPPGYLFVGLGDLGTAANPIYGIVQVDDLTDMPWSKSK